MWAQKLNEALNAVKNSLNRSTPHMLPAVVQEAELGRMADDAAAAFGSQLRRVGRNIGQNAAGIGLGSAATFAASQSLESAGKYLEKQGLDGAMKDLGQQVKKNPLPFIAVGVGLGFLIARIMPGRQHESA